MCHQQLTGTVIRLTRIQKKLNGMSGRELFRLKKSDLEKYCGKEEGHRLDSQLTLQRTNAGVCAFFSTLLKHVNWIPVPFSLNDT